MTLTNTIKYAVVITFFAVLWATVLQVVTRAPQVGAMVYWCVGVWGLLIFLIRVLVHKGKKEKS